MFLYCQKPLSNFVGQIIMVKCLFTFVNSLRGKLKRSCQRSLQHKTLQSVECLVSWGHITS